MRNEIVLYGSDSCKFCRDAKNWLKNEGIHYLMKDVQIETNRQEFLSHNVAGVPLLILRDSQGGLKEKITGFRPEKYEQVLK